MGAELEGGVMRKTELINAVAEAAGISERQADDVVASLLEQITNAMSRGEPVNLIGFGSFLVKSRAARKGKNPQTGASIDIPAAKLPSFKAGKKLKEAVEQSAQF